MKNALIFDGSIIEWITLNASIVKHGGSEVPGSKFRVKSLEFRRSDGAQYPTFEHCLWGRSVYREAPNPEPWNHTPASARVLYMSIYAGNNWI